VTAEVGSVAPDSISLSIHQFNWVDRQEFRGFIVGPSRNSIAGSTVWPGDQKPYGFFAKKTAALVLSSFPGSLKPVEPADFKGRYALWVGGDPGLLSLDVGASRELVGNVWRAGADRGIAVRGQIDPKVAHAFTLAVPEPGRDQPRTYVGYLFSRTKNATAGWVESEGLKVGFYATKLSGST
jgi:hypothetical protein